MWRHSEPVTAQGERGQAVVEFAVIGLILLALTVGLVDIGRAFYQYNEIASAAVDAARWASVQGGTCANKQITQYESTADWCNGLTTSGTAFWSLKGNYPVQGSGSCPTSYDSAGTSSYLLSDSTANGNTTIVGTVMRRLDTSSSAYKINAGNWLAGLDPRKLMVCIQLSSSFSGTTPSPQQGDVVSVFVYYQFVPVSGLFGKSLTINMAASSRYVME
jgi:hypothetical protein